MMKLIKKYIWMFVYHLLGNFAPKVLVSIHFRRSFGRWIDWKNPRDINEKIQWIKFNTDTSKWVQLADKYAVRQYIQNMGLGDMLIPLLGKWDKAEDIDWNSLPKSFVMKTNHGSGDVLICQDKSRIDTKYWTRQYSKLLKAKFGTKLGEPHYDKMVPCIIAEKLMNCDSQVMQSSSLIDYKIWAFNGSPAYIVVYFNREKESCELAIFDIDWNPHPEYSNPQSHYILSKKNVTRPQSLERMLEIASSLSKGFPVVRVDFYEVDNKPYFGELTFTPAAGFNDSYTQEFRNILGQKCILPVKKRI